MTHSFFAYMGGFAIMSQPLIKSRKEEHSQLVLSAKAVLHTALHSNDLPLITKSQILDLSKADVVAKTNCRTSSVVCYCTYHRTARS